MLYKTVCRLVCLFFVAGSAAACTNGLSGNNEALQDERDLSAAQLSAVKTPGPQCKQHSDCNDGNSCTADTCEKGQCVRTEKKAGSSCDDGNACNGKDTCWDGRCQGQGWISCDDGNVCTNDVCDPAVGCTNEVSSNCDDGNECTKDICDPQKGCGSVPADGGACDDGNLCTVKDKCLGGSCAGGQPLDCDDGNRCTQDLCEQKWGCMNPPTKKAQSCDDGNACTAGDGCVKGNCQAGKKINCDDGNPCTDDSCDPKLGCVHKPNTIACDDGDACTQKDTCSKGVCGGKAVNCDDGNVCTADSC